MTSSASSPASARSFVDTIAVNTHAGFNWGGYENIRLVTESLKYIGVNTLRDDIGTSPHAQELMKALANSGFKFDLVVSSGIPAGGAAALSQLIKDLAAFEKANPGSIIAVEGLNEVNIQAFSYNGSSSMEAAARFQKDLYSALKADATLKNVSVYNTTIANDSKAAYAALGDLSKYSDYANSHAYITTNAWSTDDAMDYTNALAQNASKNKPLVVTETGYTTLEKTQILGANETAQAKMILNTLMTAFQNGVEKTYLYELVDRSDDPADKDFESHFGLFNTDGTPKKAANALHNLTTILNDDGQGGKAPTAPIGYKIADMPQFGDSFQLTKSNGAHDIVVWAAPKIWNDAADREFVNPDKPVKLTLDAVASVVKVYDPMKGTAPIATYQNVKDITLPISDHPLIVEVGGNELIPRAVATTPASVSMTAEDFMGRIDALKESPTLKTIVLTDTKTIPVASVDTMRHMIAKDQAVLSKIDGPYKFAVSLSAPTWSKVTTYNADGTLYATTDAGLKDGKIVTEQTKFADGSVDTVNYVDGKKTNEIFVHADGTKDTYVFNVKNQVWATEHVTYAKSGAMTLYERLQADGTKVFTEANIAGKKIVTWYEKGVAIKQTTVLADGTSTTDFNPSASTPVTAPKPPVSVDTGPTVTGTAESIVEKLATLKTSTTLQKIVLTDTKALPIESAAAIKDFVAKNAAVLAKIEGGYQFAVIESGANWKKTVLYDAKGVLVSTTDAGVSNGQIITQKTVLADGTIDVVNFSNGTKTNETIFKTDGTKQTYVYGIRDKDYVTEHASYDKSGTLVGFERLYANGKTAFSEITAVNGKTVSWFDSSGTLTKSVLQKSDGGTVTSAYTYGVLTQTYTVNADKSVVNTTHNVRGLTYTTEVQKIDKAGSLTEVTRTHADGTLDYLWSKAANGTVSATTFDAKGVKTTQLVTKADGAKDYFTYGIKNQPYATEHSTYDKNGKLTVFERYEADGSIHFSETYVGGIKTVSWYNDNGVLTKQVIQPTAAASSANMALASSASADSPDTTKTIYYENGIKTKVHEVAGDGSQTVTVLNVRNQPYVSETKTIDAAGTLTEIVRKNADDALTYRWAQSADGATTTSSYDVAGVKQTDLTVKADGAMDLFRFNVAGKPGATSLESFNAQKVATLVDIALADGTHNITAKSAGVTLTGGKGADIVTMFGNNRFVFTGGKDVVSNFHADDAAANHDVVQISKSLAAGFSALNVAQVGSDAVVTISTDHSITFKNVDVHKINASDFWFV